MSGIALHAPFAGWLSTLDEVDDPVFAERMMGDGFAINPLDPVLRAPADGVVASVAATGHALTLTLPGGRDVLMHIGLDTVALGGAGFDVRVEAGDAVRRGDALIAFDLDVVGTAAKDLVTPIVLPDAAARVTIERPARLVAAGEVVAWIEAPSRVATGSDAAAGGPAIDRTITVAAAHGLHARPAARIVRLLGRFAAQVTVHRGDRHADARSVTGLLSLGATAGDALVWRAQGADAEAALDAVEAFAATRFGDAADDAPVAAVAGAGPVRAAPGLAIGRTWRLRFAVPTVAEDGVGIAHETAALDAALRTVDARLAGGGDIAEAHRAILADPALRRAAEAAIATGRSAGAAWRAATAEAAAALIATHDPRLAERVADLRDLDGRVLAALTGEAPAMPELPADAILLADDLLPSQFQALDLARLAGVCTAAGGPTAHVAILAAAAGVPMIVAAGAAAIDVADGTTAILDADAARLVVDPSAGELDAAAARLAAQRGDRRDALRDAQEPARTADGIRIEVFANCGSVGDAGAAAAAGAEGCGLLRTEFLFLDRDTAPGEAEQAALYRRIAAALGDRPLIVRTLDIGGDKPVPYLPIPSEENPALGRRGVRLSLARPDLLAAQLRAIVAGVPGAQCRIMLPMVVDLGELATVRAMLDEATRAVGRTDRVELGVMIETPAAALLADQLAEVADFLSVGTNDLTQYALAADRGNAGVAAMVDALHPAVLRLIRHAAEGAARHGRWLGVCGGLASDPQAAALLVGLGVTELSATPAAVPAVKAAVRGTTLPAARRLAEAALAATSPAAVRALIEERRT